MKTMPDIETTASTVVEGVVNLRISKRNHMPFCRVFLPLHKRVSCSRCLDARLLWLPRWMSRKLRYIPQKESTGLSVSVGANKSYSSWQTLIAFALRCHSCNYRYGRTIQDYQHDYSADSRPCGLPLVALADLEGRPSQQDDLHGLFSFRSSLRDRLSYTPTLHLLVVLGFSLCEIFGNDRYNQGNAKVNGHDRGTILRTNPHNPLRASRFLVLAY